MIEGKLEIKNKKGSFIIEASKGCISISFTEHSDIILRQKAIELMQTISQFDTSI